jgi:transcriptional regulator with XRE-family HTH domain
MMTARRSPTVRRRRLGGELRQLRESAGLTIERVADALKFSNSKISRIETGQVSATPSDVRRVLKLYNVGASGGVAFSRAHWKRGRRTGGRRTATPWLCR